MSMMRVISCRASQTSRQKLLGGRGGITLAPNTSFRYRRSSGDPLRPDNTHSHTHTRTHTHTLTVWQGNVPITRKHDERIASVWSLFSGREKRSRRTLRSRKRRSADDDDDAARTTRELWIITTEVRTSRDDAYTSAYTGAAWVGGGKARRSVAGRPETILATAVFILLRVWTSSHQTDELSAVCGAARRRTRVLLINYCRLSLRVYINGTTWHIVVQEMYTTEIKHRMSYSNVGISRFPWIVNYTLLLVTNYL